MTAPTLRARGSDPPEASIDSSHHGRQAREVRRRGGARDAAWCCPPTTSPSTAGQPHDPLRLVPTVPDPDQPEIDDGVAGMVGAP